VSGEGNGKRPVLFIAGGGTGGHVFPGLAVAEAVRSLADVEVVFVGTARGLESKLVPSRGYGLELLDVLPLKGGGAVRAAKSVFAAARASAASFSLLRRYSPRAVLSVGGYAAGPVSLAAAALRIPLAVLEPNSVTGLANRWLSPFCARAYIAFPDAAKDFAARKVRTFGVPLRSGFLSSEYVPGDSLRLLVLGGSLGARAINDRMPQVVAALSARHPSLSVLHQTGKDEVAQTAEAYARAGVTQVSVVPFVDDVPGELAKADVVVSRAGAGSVSEICAVGRASILIPFPHAADDHQAKNARAAADAGAAVLLRQETADVPRLTSELGRLLSDPALRSDLARKAAAFGKPDAALTIGRDFMALGNLR
jgi:UDP-N-acetylglucosamine--N-acetylmuramyl-(pentapeptide) pyrophosphoryl-undecaprenol N-acetylglucosamine transferase